MNESHISSRQQQQDESEHADPRKIRLEVALPWQPVATDSLLLHRIVETQIDYTDDSPINQSRHGDQILKPAEDRRGAVGQRHVSQTDKQADESDSDPRNPESRRSLEDSWRAAFEGETIQDAGAVEQARVACAPGAGKNDSYEGGKNRGLAMLFQCVKLQAIPLMIDGTILIPALDAAMTKGEAAAVPEDCRRSGSLEGTTRPTIKIDKT